MQDLPLFLMVGMLVLMLVVAMSFGVCARLIPFGRSRVVGELHNNYIQADKHTGEVRVSERNEGEDSRVLCWCSLYGVGETA